MLGESQASKEEKLSLIRDELAAKDQKLRDTQVSYHKKKSQLEALSNLTERYEGYGGSIKRVMEHREREKGIIGVVADIIKVDKKYETAIETALGGNIQNIVTDNEDTAKRMIAFLKQSKGGRATFLPLTSITNPQEFKNQPVLKEEGVIGIADQLAKVDPKYRNVAKSLLGRILVVDHVDHAVKIARKYGYSIRMVTLEGEMLVPGGAISGGTFKNSSNLLGRRREMEELEARVKEYLKEIDGLLQEIEDTKAERNRLRLGLEEDKASLQRKFIEQNTARLNVIKARERRDEASEGSQELKAEEREIENQIREIRESKEEIQKELRLSEETEKQVEAEIQEFQKQLDEKRAEESEESQNAASWDVEVEKMLQQQGFHQQNVDRINGEIERFASELKEIEEGILKSSKDTAYKESDIEQLEKTIEASQTTQGDTEKKLKEDIEKKEQLSLKQKNFFADRESLSEKMTGLDKEVYRLSSQKEKFQEQLEGQINVLKEQINTVRMNDEHYDNRLHTIRIEIEARQGQLKELSREQEDVRGKLLEVTKKDQEARKMLIAVQSRIAGQTAEVETSKQEIMELLETGPLPVRRSSTTTPPRSRLRPGRRSWTGS